MKKTLIWLVVIALAVTMAFMGMACKAATTTTTTAAAETTATVTTTASETTQAAETTTKKTLTVGHVTIGRADWYASLGNAVDLIAKKYNTNIYRISSDGDLEKELAAVEDMITKEVDGIILGSQSAEAAQKAAQKCNEAGIPVVIENSAIADGPGKVVSDIEFDWYDLGKRMAEKTAELYPGAKVLIFTGTLGTGPIDLLNKGWEESIPSLGIKTAKLIATNYSTEISMAEVQNAVQSGLKFDVIWCHDDSMSDGVVQGLKAINKLGEYPVFSSNAEAADLEDGNLVGIFSYSPGFHGLITFLTMYNYLIGKDVKKLDYVPMRWVTKDNINEIFKADVDESDIPVAEKYIDTGKF